MSLKVLVLSRNYPNNVMALAGLWVEGLVRAISHLCEVRVVSPVPYCPPLTAGTSYGQFRRIRRCDQRHGINVSYPRFLTGPARMLYRFEATGYYLSVRKEITRLRRTFPFVLIHAHFGYPDGVVAARLARRHHVPLLLSEHAPWIPWMESDPWVRARAVRAARAASFHIAGSEYVRRSIVRFTGESDRLRTIPIGVDPHVFTRPPNESDRDPDQILYVGRIHTIKGVDVLLRAMRDVVGRRPSAHLTLVGGGFPFRDYLRQEDALRRLASELKLDRHVEFVGGHPPSVVAKWMRASAVLVLPSRAEAFGAVLVEALASGTPVIATRCGGPEDVVNEQVGRLVPTDDPGALADAIVELLTHRGRYDPAHLRTYAVDAYSWEKVAGRTVELYEAAVGARPAHA